MSTVSEGTAVRAAWPAETSLDSFGGRFVRWRRIARWLLLADVIVFGLLTAVFHNPKTYTNSPQGTVLGVLGNVTVLLFLLAVIRIATLRTAREVVVAADPARVFALVTDPQSWLRLSGSRRRRIESVQPLPSGGTNGVSSYGSGRLTWETLEFEPSKRVVTFSRTRGRVMPQAMLAKWSLEPRDGGTCVRFEQRTKLFDPFGLYGLVAAWIIGRLCDRTLARLRTEVEA